MKKKDLKKIANSCVSIDSLNCEQPALRSRLLALGFTDGRALQIGRAADPVLVGVMGTTVALRLSELGVIKVS